MRAAAIPPISRPSGNRDWRGPISARGGEGVGASAAYPLRRTLKLAMRFQTAPVAYFDHVRRIDQLSTEDDVPTPKQVVIVTGGRKPKWLRLLCPCGCGDVLALNLMRTAYPSWTARIHRDGRVSVTPSVVSGRCGSHFWIRRSHVLWCSTLSAM